LDEPQGQRTGPRQAIGDVAGLVLCVVFAFCALLPVSAFSALRQPWTAAVIAGFGAALFATQRWPRKVWLVAQIPFYMLVGVNLALTAGLVLVVLHYVFPLALAAGVLNYLLARRWGRFRATLIFTVALLALFFVSPASEVQLLAVLGVFAVLIPIFLGGAPRVPSLLVSCAIVTLICVGLFDGYFYSGYHADLTQRVVGQPGMRLLADPRSRDSSQILGRRAIFAAKSCDRRRLLIATELGAYIKDLSGPDSGEGVLNHRAGDEVAYECERDAVWVGVYSPGGLAMLGGDLHVRQVFPAPGRAVTNLRRAGNLLLAGDDLTTDGLVIDLTADSFRPALRGVGSRDLLANPKTGRYIGATVFRVHWIDPRTGDITKTMFVPSMQIRLDLDEARGDLYVSSFSSGVLYRVDAASGEIRARLKLGAGLRYLRVLPDESLLAIGNYATGALHLVRLPDLKVLATVFAGRRIRSLNRSPGDNELTFVSAAGVFAWNWRQALGSN